MTINTEQKKTLQNVSEQLLDTLARVADVARFQFNKTVTGASGSVLASQYNPMVGGQLAEQNLASIISQNSYNLQRMQAEPFVARLVVRWEDQSPPQEETIYVSRASVAGLSSHLNGLKLATYTAPLGRLAEFETGDEKVPIRIGNRKRSVSILERVTLNPRFLSGEWDALDDYFDFYSWDFEIDSIRRFIKQHLPPSVQVDDEIPDVLSLLLDDQDDHDIQDRTKRRVIEHMSLRDQPILDRYQGKIFRMPLDRQLLLLGPPGTGKTTTLIRRLAQKRNADALTAEEHNILSSAGVQDSFLYSNRWMMFSPTELLKLYLRDSFNREGVPAHDNNLKTWEKERLHLSRNVLGILRSANAGHFQLEEKENFLLDTSSTGGYHLYKEFSSFLLSKVVNRAKEALTQLYLSDDEELKTLVRRAVGQNRSYVNFSIREIFNLLSNVDLLQPKVRQLDEGIKGEIRDLLNRLVYFDRELLVNLFEALPQLPAEEQLEEGEEDNEDTEDATLTPAKEPQSRREKQKIALDALSAAIRGIAQALAQGRSTVTGRSGQVIAFLGDRLPEHDLLSSIGKRIIIAKHLRSLVRAPQEFVLGAPKYYKQFRQQSLKAQRLFSQSAGKSIKELRISPAEADVLILTILRNARSLFDVNPTYFANSTPDWLENIKSQYVMQVFVDEATDFSTVQLACTMELTHPRLRSWFACGDFNQRITSYGIQANDEIKQLEEIAGKKIKKKKIATPYRQSRKLQELAKALSADDSNDPTAPARRASVQDTDINPLLAEQHTDEQLAHWLAERISEIERAIGKLPSIAIFVKDEQTIDQLVNLLAPLLERHNLPIVGCKDGRIVGDALEVRVFDIQHIKGLEFEAVFFVGVDELALLLPNLFDRYFYVGVSRAATYLGVTCNTTLPVGLEHIRGHFSTGNWKIAPG